MILGLGIDLVEVERIHRSVERFGDRFLQRILCPAEIAYCQKFRSPALNIAARFAAKEAMAKAFGTGIGHELGWLDMEVSHHESGEPFVILHGRGQTLLAQRAGRALLISLSHTEHYATAIAMLEGV